MRKKFTIGEKEIHDIIAISEKMFIDVFSLICYSNIRGDFMANKKKNESIKGISQVPENKLTVQKSNPLLSLSQSDLTLAEFKILDTYLSRINSHDQSKRMVTFEKGELENLLGVTRITNHELDKRLEHLQGSTVKVIDPTIKRGFRRITLFEMSHAIQDDDGLWTIELMCTPSAMQYIFNVEGFGYLCYKLRSITSISSRYAYILFLFLEKNRYRKTWQIELEELKQILKCDDNDETLKQYKYFNRDVLKRCQKEIHEKTECRYSYEPIKKGRKVVAIKFALETLKDFDEIALEEETERLEDEELERYNSLPEWEQWIEDYCKCCDDIFTKVEMQEFIGMTNKLPLSQMYKNAPVDDINIHRYEYILDKYRAFKVADSKDPKNNKYAYFKRMIEKDIAEYE